MANDSGPLGHRAGGAPSPPPLEPAPRNSGARLLMAVAALLLVLIAGVALLYSTGVFGGGRNNVEAANSPSGKNLSMPSSPATAPRPVPRPSPPAPKAGPAPTPAPTPAPNSGSSSSFGNFALSTQLRIAVTQFQPRLPLRVGPATVTRISANGTNLAMDVAISQRLAPDQLERLVRSNVCSGPIAQAVRAGASVTVNARDAGGVTRTYNVTAC